MCRAAKLLLLLLPALSALQPLPARTGSVTRSLVDSMYAYTQREGLAIGHLRAQIYVKFGVQTHRVNALMRLIPFVSRMEHGDHSYIGESVTRIAYTAPLVLDRKEVAFYSTNPYMRNLRDMILANLSISLYEPTLLRDRVLSPFNRRNRGYYRYAADSLLTCGGRPAMRLTYRPRYRNMQLVTGWAYVDCETGQVREADFSFTYNSQHFDCHILPGTAGLASLLPVGMWIDTRFGFARNWVRLRLYAHGDYADLLPFDAVRMDSVLHHSRYDLTPLNQLNSDTTSVIRDLSYIAAQRAVPLTPAEDSLYSAYAARRRQQEAERQASAVHRRSDASPAPADSATAGLAADSVALLRPEPQRSIFRNLDDLLLGSHYITLNSTDIIKLPPVITPSMVEWSNNKGLSVKTRIRYQSQWRSDRSLLANLHLGYALKFHQFFFKLPVDFTFAPRHGGVLHLEVGNGNRIYNSSQAEDIRRALSRDMSMDSLLKAFDHYKFDLYNDYYLKLSAQYELVNGLKARLGWVYHGRKLIGWNEVGASQGLDHRYRSLAPNVRLEWTPGLYYYWRGHQKRALFSRWPTFSLEYERGIKAFNCDGEYERWETEANYMIPLYALRKLYLRVGGGWYTKYRNTYFVDFTNFHYNSLPDTWQDEMLGRFESLDSRWYSESEYYFRTCVSYESPMLLFSRINPISPYIKRERIYSNILVVHALFPYWEAGYSVSTHLFDFGVFSGVANHKAVSFGCKFVLRFLENN